MTLDDLGNLRDPSPELLRAALRQDMFSFARKAFELVFPYIEFEINWHHKLLAKEMQDVLEGRCHRLIINLPPRSLKSFFASIILPAFALGRFPSMNVVCVSYANELALKFARDCRALMQTTFYTSLFPETRILASRRAEHDFMTTLRGGRLAVSVGGALTGRGGDLFIVDDPMKPADATSPVMRASLLEWAANTLMSRMNDKRTGAMIVVMQRLHDDDLTGHLLRQGGWRLVSLPAIATRHEAFWLGGRQVHERFPGDLLHPAYETPEVLEGLKLSMGSSVFAAQYQQDPVPPDSPHIRWDWFQVYEQVPQKDHATEVWQSWDTAIKDGELNDYSVGITVMVKGGKYYILDVCRRKLDYPSLKQLIEQKAAQYPGARVLIEDKGSGSSLIQDLKRSGQVKPLAFVPEGDKVSRFICQTAVIERGDVFLPKSAHWMEDFRRELLQFPTSKHDDQVDALSQFLAHMEFRKRNRVHVSSVEEFLFGSRKPLRR